MQLKIGSTLQGGKYRLEKILGQGGFGITYLAEQTNLERKVAIKEFFMKEFCNRDEESSYVTVGTEGSREMIDRFREKFLKEARNIAKLIHPNIVKVIDVFEENGTAYYVMEYATGGSLADKLKLVGYMSEPEARHYIVQIANALGYIHKQNMNHLDVKPANIMLDGEGNVMLIDFGLSKQYDQLTGNQTSTTPVGISEGYAPMEQYMVGGVGDYSPQTDIYALGATYYKLLTGKTPPNANFVGNEGLPLDVLQTKGISQISIDTIVKAMEPLKRNRMASADEFLRYLSGSNVQKPRPEVVPEATQTIIKPRAEQPRIPRPEPKYRTEVSNVGTNNTLLYAIIAVLVLLLVGVGVFIINNQHKSDPTTAINVRTSDNDNDGEKVTTPEKKTEEPVDEPVERKVSPYGDKKVTGLIAGKYAITMDLTVEGGKAYGSYYYDKYGSNNRLFFRGNYDAQTGSLYLEEYNDVGENSGIFDGQYDGRVFHGTFTNSEEQTMNFNLDVR